MQIVPSCSSYPAYGYVFNHIEGKIAKLGASIRSYLPGQISSPQRLTKLAVMALALASLVFIVSIVPSSGISLLAGMAIGSALLVLAFVCAVAIFPIPNQQEMRQQFLNAARDGNVERVYWLLGAGMGQDVNYRHENGSTVLIQAALENQIEVVKTLTQVPGIDVNVADDLGNTALIMATKCRSRRVVEDLLKAPGIDIHRQDQRGRTALMEAVAWGSLEVVGLLIEAGANVDLRDHQGMTAQQIAIQAGNPYIVGAISCSVARRTVRAG